MNKYEPHVYVIPEDDRDRQLADGFVLHHRVDNRRIQVMPPAGGWAKVLDTFKDEYIPKLKENPKTHVVMLIDFDGCFDHRRADFEKDIPDSLRPRVFVVGSKDTPEALRKALSKSFEKIGTSLADDCDAGTTRLWNHDQLVHNEPDRDRMFQTIKPFLFTRD